MFQSFFFFFVSKCVFYTIAKNKKKRRFDIDYNNTPINHVFETNKRMYCDHELPDNNTIDGTWKYTDGVEISFRFLINSKNKTIQLIYMNKYDFGIIFHKIPDIICPVVESHNHVQFICKF